MPWPQLRRVSLNEPPYESAAVGSTFTVVVVAFTIARRLSTLLPS